MVEFFCDNDMSQSERFIFRADTPEKEVHDLGKKDANVYPCSLQKVDFFQNCYHAFGVEIEGEIHSCAEGVNPDDLQTDGLNEMAQSAPRKAIKVNRIIMVAVHEGCGYDRTPRRFQDAIYLPQDFTGAGAMLDDLIA